MDINFLPDSYFSTADFFFWIYVHLSHSPPFSFLPVFALKQREKLLVIP